MGFDVKGTQESTQECPSHKLRGKFLLRIFTGVATLILLQSCIVYPDPWREEVFERVAQPNEDPRLVMYVVSSGFEFDLHSPYGISMYFQNDENAAESLEIREILVYYADLEIQSLSLHTWFPTSPVELGMQIRDIAPAPCCKFGIATERFELDHKEGDILTVRLSYCLVGSNECECVREERQFKAVVKKGYFGMTSV